MKFISCHIENFGKLHDYSIDFVEGMNNICEENGWGKSTFAAFVKAMFYGLDGERKRNVEENERKRYMPWQGGVFGGQVIFELNGKEYKLSRIFRDKEANDEFELRDAKTNLISNDFSKRIGEEIFKINQESFVRTMFIGQSECETVATDDINAKIGNLTDNTNDLNNFDAAYARLTEIINKLNPGRISGSIAKRKEEIAKYDRIVNDGREISNSIDTYQGYLQAEIETYNTLKTKLKEAGDQQTKVSKLQSVIAKKSEWERLTNSVQEKKQVVAVCKNKFPGDVPESDALKQKITECGDLDKIAERMSICRLSEKEKNELTELNSYFLSDIPQESDIDKMIETAGQYRNVSKKLNSDQMSSVEQARLEELEPYFAEETESPAQVISKWNDRNTKKATLPSHKAALMALKASMSDQKSQETSKKGSGLFVAGILIMVIGAVLLAETVIVGLAFIVLGAIMLVFGKRSRREKSEPTQPEMPSEYIDLISNIQQDTEFIEKVDQEVAKYLAAHGKQFEESEVSAILQEIATKSVEYSTLKKKALVIKENAKSTELDDLQKILVEFLNKYGVKSEEASFSDDLYELKNKVNRFNLLKEKMNQFTNAECEYKAIESTVYDFLKKFAYEPSENLSLQLNNIREYVDEYQNALKILANAEEDTARFEFETDFKVLNEVRIEENLPSLEELNHIILHFTEEMEKTNNTIRGYNKVLEDLQVKYDEWEDSRAKLNELKELQHMEQIRYDYVFKARAKLGLAKEAMTSKYVDPILNGFSKYFEMIAGNSAEKFHMDANTTITVDECGKQRSVNTLSSGYKDLVGICLRVALVDAMYKEEMPVLILDDPFISLDDEKISACKEFLNKVSENYQIIYFTCSSSRNWN